MIWNVRMNAALCIRNPIPPDDRLGLETSRTKDVRMFLILLSFLSWALLFALNRRLSRALFDCFPFCFDDSGWRWRRRWRHARLRVLVHVAPLQPVRPVAVRKLRLQRRNGRTPHQVRQLVPWMMMILKKNSTFFT